MSVGLDEVQQVRDQAECLVPASVVDAALDRMAAAVAARLGGLNPLVYSVMTGGFMATAGLLSRLDFPLEVDYLHATRYGNRQRGEALEWRVRPSRNVLGRHVLVVDDILDEGNTLAAIVDQLLAEGAAEVLTAVLVHKAHERKARPGMRADFTGVEVADRFLFGCGMDYKGYWRNLPAVYALADEV